MAIGAAVIAFFLLVALIAGYMRYGPKFFGREAAPRPLPPGSRPVELARRAAAMRPTVAAPLAGALAAPAPAAQAAAPAAAASAVAVAERPSAPAEPER